MTEKLELYRCNVCKNLVEVVLPSYGTLVCCNQDMELLNPKTKDVGEEKHVPVIETYDEEKIIRVGATPHPMQEEHYVQFIEVISNDEKYVKRKYLYPNEAPLMNFKCECKEGMWARELCNIHGLWATKKGEEK